MGVHGPEEDGLASTSVTKVKDSHCEFLGSFLGRYEIIYQLCMYISVFFIFFGDPVRIDANAKVLYLMNWLSCINASHCMQHPEGQRGNILLVHKRYQ